MKSYLKIELLAIQIYNCNFELFFCINHCEQSLLLISQQYPSLHNIFSDFAMENSGEIFSNDEDYFHDTCSSMEEQDAIEFAEEIGYASVLVQDTEELVSDIASFSEEISQEKVWKL